MKPFNHCLNTRNESQHLCSILPQTWPHKMHLLLVWSDLTSTRSICLRPPLVSETFISGLGHGAFGLRRRAQSLKLLQEKHWISCSAFDRAQVMVYSVQASVSFQQAFPVCLESKPLTHSFIAAVGFLWNSSHPNPEAWYMAGLLSVSHFLFDATLSPSGAGCRVSCQGENRSPHVGS